MGKKVAVALLALVLVTGACTQKPKQTSNDVDRERQEAVTGDLVNQAGIPNVKNGREIKLVNDLYEMRDQTGLVTFTYTRNDFTGKFVWFCASIGYPIPYAIQRSAPESMQTYKVTRENHADDYGVARLPQPEPNGLFSPESAEGTWVRCKNPETGEENFVYSEPKLTTLQWKLPDWQVEGQNG